jgi:hypothetical protein
MLVAAESAKTPEGPNPIELIGPQQTAAEVQLVILFELLL